MHTPQRCTNLDGKIDKDHPTPILNPLTIHASNFSPSVLSIMYHICCLHAMEQGKATCYDYHTCTELSWRAMVKCSRSPWLYGVVPSVISPFILLAIASEVCSLLECDVLISLSLSLSFFLFQLVDYLASYPLALRGYLINYCSLSSDAAWLFTLRFPGNHLAIVDHSQPITVCTAVQHANGNDIHH